MSSIICLEPISFHNEIAKNPDVKAFQKNYKILQITSIALAALAASLIAASFVYTIPLAATGLVTIAAAAFFRDVRNISLNAPNVLKSWIDQNKEKYVEWARSICKIDPGSTKTEVFIAFRKKCEKIISGTLKQFGYPPCSKRHLVRTFPKLFPQHICKLANDSNLHISNKEYDKYFQQLYSTGKPLEVTTTETPQKVRDKVNQAAAVYLFKYIFEHPMELRNSKHDIHKLEKAVSKGFNIASTKKSLFEGNLLLRSWMVP